jgi:hypothetical protein
MRLITYQEKILKFPISARLIPDCLFITFLLISSISRPVFSQDSAEEDTYSISLTQTADLGQDVREIDEKKVLIEKYTARNDDHIWKILRERGLLEKGNLAELLAMLKALNSSLNNLDLIHPGQEIVIPLIIAPTQGMPATKKKEPPRIITLEEAKKLDTENYTIERGDSIIRVMQQHYDIPESKLYDEYIDLIKNMNPSIKDLNQVHPGQQIRLPIYSPQTVRMPIEPELPKPAPYDDAERERFRDTGAQLGEIIKLLGEEWVNSGKHFIPLKSGGQINLAAESYPIIDLASGNKIIVDLYNDLPDKMAKLITSNWDNYRIINLAKNDDLKSALDKIIKQCDYPEIYSSEKPLVLGGDIPLKITSDWAIKKETSQPENSAGITIINIYGDNDPRIPGSINTFLKGLDINIIEHPREIETEAGAAVEPEIITVEDGQSSIIEILMDLAGQNFSRDAEIPIYQSQREDFNLTVKADFLFNRNGSDCIIDLRGLGADIINLLKEHQFRVLSVKDETGPSLTVTSVLDFLELEYSPNPHSFSVLEQGSTKNIQMMIPGILFNDINNRTIFATALNLPPALKDFLSDRDYKILQLPPS